jgi:hypothetical protein
MSSRQKRKIARVNGAKAAGTKSPEGLQRSSLNALRHGLTGKTLVLSNESQAKFDELLEGYINKFKPQDPVEHDLVTEMVAARWRLQRIWLIQTAALDFQMDSMEAEIDQKFASIIEPMRLSLAFTTMANEQRSLQLLLRYESTYRRMYNQAQKDLLRLRASDTYNEIPNEPKPAVEPFAPAPKIAVPQPKVAQPASNDDAQPIEIGPQSIPDPQKYPNYAPRERK